MPTQEVLQQIKEIIYKHISAEEFDVFLFGSRAEGTASQFSDFDIGIQGEKELKAIDRFNIELELENSDIPYIIEIVDFNKVDTQFEKIAKQHIISL